MTLDIEQYRTAAVLMCERMDIWPNDAIHVSSMRWIQAWEHYAGKMAEHCLMVETLRECGRYPEKKE